MPRGSNAKREHEYEELKEEFKESGRYKRAKFSETEEEKAKDKKGKSPDRDLPITGYDHLTIKEILKRLGSLTSSQIQKIRSYEKKHKNRKTLLEQLDRKLEQ
jgi:hypothetical protein